MFFDSEKASQPMVCNHNISKLIAHAKKTRTAIAGTKYNFMVDAPEPIVISAAEKAQTRKKLSDRWF